MTRILLVRHGQSTWNETGRWQGQADPPLTDLGRHQASMAAKSIGMVDAIMCSTLERATVTGEIISSALGIGPLLELPGLIERNAGEWEGMTRSEIERDFPGYLADGRRPPNWESDERLSERVLGTLDAITARLPEADVICISHGGVIMCIEERFGAGRHRIANLGGRWLTSTDVYGYDLGDRIDLLEGHDVTVPDQI